MAAWRPNTHASYSATLLVQSKLNFAVNGQWFPSGDINTAPTPRPKAFDAPLKYIFHPSFSGDVFFSICNTANKSSYRKSKLMGSYSSLALSARKSAIALLLMAFSDIYRMSNFYNRTCHLATLPDSEGFSKTYLMGSNFAMSQVV